MISGYLELGRAADGGYIPAKSIRFKINLELYEKKIPFEFKDVPLP
jgi:hypothetical protein